MSLRGALQLLERQGLRVDIQGRTRSAESPGPNPATAKPSSSNCHEALKGHPLGRDAESPDPPTLRWNPWWPTPAGQAVRLLRGHSRHRSGRPSASPAHSSGSRRHRLRAHAAEDDRSDQIVIKWAGRAALGHLAANFHDNPTERLKVIAITGTNGKTTVATLLHRLARMFDRKAGLVSTVENRIVDRVVPATHTTPDPVGLQKLFADMLDAGCTHCFMEASSHALDQHRLAGSQLTGGVFTNITTTTSITTGISTRTSGPRSPFDKLPATALP